MKQSLEIQFINKREIRMGAEFNICKLNIIGKVKPNLSGDDFQDILCWSLDFNFLALVRWNINNNNPGFNVYIINCKQNDVKKSDRIEGCCESIEWVNNHFLYKCLKGRETIAGKVIV